MLSIVRPIFFNSWEICATQHSDRILQQTIVQIGMVCYLSSPSVSKWATIHILISSYQDYGEIIRNAKYKLTTNKNTPKGRRQWLVAYPKNVFILNVARWQLHLGGPFVIFSPSEWNSSVNIPISQRRMRANNRKL